MWPRKIFENGALLGNQIPMIFLSNPRCNVRKSKGLNEPRCWQWDPVAEFHLLLLSKWFRLANEGLSFHIRLHRSRGKEGRAHCARKIEQSPPSLSPVLMLRCDASLARTDGLIYGNALVCKLKKEEVEKNVSVYFTIKACQAFLARLPGSPCQLRFLSHYNQKNITGPLALPLTVTMLGRQKTFQVAWTNAIEQHQLNKTIEQKTHSTKGKWTTE